MTGSQEEKLRIYFYFAKMYYDKTYKSAVYKHINKHC